MAEFLTYDVKVYDQFIHKFAERYVDQRSAKQVDFGNLDPTFLQDCGFNIHNLETVIRRNSVAIDFKREQGLKPNILNDIYRSDLGELLMTYYFEEKIGKDKRFIIPLKNISNRELAHLPGRGLDAIGYRMTNDKIEILLGEAKVSAQQQSPPAVVDQTNDSIYNTQKLHHNDRLMILRKLSDYCRRLGAQDVIVLGCAILYMNNNQEDKYSLTLGCTLIRDYNCSQTDDFGKMKSKQAEFEPDNIHFVVLSFTQKTIDETVDLFYKEVQKMTRQ